MALTPLLTLIGIVNNADKIRFTFLSIWMITFVSFYHTDTTQRQNISNANTMDYLKDVSIRWIRPVIS